MILVVDVGNTNITCGVYGKLGKDLTAVAYEIHRICGSTDVGKEVNGLAKESCDSAYNDTGYPMRNNHDGLDEGSKENNSVNEAYRKASNELLEAEKLLTRKYLNERENEKHARNGNAGNACEKAADERLDLYVGGRCGEGCPHAENRLPDCSEIKLRVDYALKKSLNSF